MRSLTGPWPRAGSSTVVPLPRGAALARHQELARGLRHDRPRHARRASRFYDTAFRSGRKCGRAAARALSAQHGLVSVSTARRRRRPTLTHVPGQSRNTR